MSLSRQFIYMAVMSTVITSCSPSNDKVGETFCAPSVTVDNGVFSPEVLWSFGYVGAPSVSPDGKTLLFSISFADIKENTQSSEVYSMPIGGGSITQITDGHGKSSSDPVYLSDGRIAFLREDEAGVPQVFIAEKDGGNAHAVLSDADNAKYGVDAFLFSPDSKRIALIRSIKIDKDIHDLYPDLPKANARIETDLMYRHWNQWSDGAYSHVCIANLVGDKLTDEVDIMDGERFHSPLRPHGGIEQVAWSPDASKIAYTSKKLTGRESALSTNSDIYLYDIASAQTENVSAPNAGYDTNPAFDSKNRLFWLSMEHDGYESDRNRIMCKDLSSGELTDFTEGSELYVSQFVLSSGGNELWFIADKEAKDAIFHVDIASKTTSQLTHDCADYTSLAVAGESLLSVRTSMFCPPEIYKVNKADGVASNLSNVNTETLSKLNMGKAEERWITTTDGKKMLTWVILPPDFDSNKKYPALLYCEGGPQSTISQFWSKRWNFALMAANGYVVVAPCRRGMPGFGVEWNEQISKDYGGQNMKDYLTAIDTLASESFVDENRLGCVGASYGGFSVYWLAGHHEKRFKTFIAHCGIFNLDQLYSTTEELFFVNWDLGGAYWDTDNAAAQASFAQSPHRFVGKWDTPILVIHGEKDFRIPYTQGMGAFDVARMKGLEAEFLYFPDECHWVQKPQNSILWHREFYRWLDKWLK